MGVVAGTHYSVTRISQREIQIHASFVDCETSSVFELELSIKLDSNLNDLEWFGVLFQVLIMLSQKFYICFMVEIGPTSSKISLYVILNKDSSLMLDYNTKYHR